MRTRLGILSIVGLLIASIFSPAAMGAQELELLAATDALQTSGRTTVDSLFWRSGFGASVLGGPTYAGNQANFDARVAAIEALTGGTTPTGVRPIFLEFATLDDASYASGSVVPSDYATQRWNFTNGSRVTGAWTLGAGAAADGAWASYLLRTNHHANGTQDPAGPLYGATAADGVLGLWLVEGLMDRVTAITMYGAYNGSALGAFNLTDPALNDNDPSNGWQLVPESLLVTFSSDPEPLFTGFAPSNNATTLAGQAMVILGLANIVKLSDPSGPNAGVFDGDPYDATLYNNSAALLNSVVMNMQAAHWDATALTYLNPGGPTATGELAFLVKALAAAEGSANASVKATYTAARLDALSSLRSLSDAFGVFAASYDVSGSTITPDFSSVDLWGQAGALAALSAVYGETGLKADYDWLFKASAGLESQLYANGSYRASSTMQATETVYAWDVAVLIAGLRDLALTGEEPLAIYRLINATQWLFTAPPLTLSGASAPPVIGASFQWNASNHTYSAGASDFDAVGALLASYEFLTAGPEFLAAVGGGVFVTERAALLLHNATVTEVGASIDALEAQIAGLQGQLATLQASFDALNANVTAITDRLNLSIENETISAARIVDLQANVTLLRSQLNYTTENLTLTQLVLSNASGRYADLEARFNGTNQNLTTALGNASSLAGQLDIIRGQLEDAHTAMGTTNTSLDNRAKELGRAQQTIAFAVIGGMVAGALVLMFLQKYVLTQRTPEEKAAAKAAREAEKKAAAEEKAKAEKETEDEHEDDHDDDHDHDDDADDDDDADK